MNFDFKIRIMVVDISRIDHLIKIYEVAIAVMKMAQSKTANIGIYLEIVLSSSVENSSFLFFFKTFRILFVASRPPVTV